MNFLQFLKLDESEIEYHTLSKVKIIEKKVRPETKLKVVENIKIENPIINPYNFLSNKKKINNDDNEYNEKFKKDDFVRIKYLKDSNLNIYKGYNGEIKQYIKDSSEAMIILEALPYPRVISFPIKHFYKLT